MRHHSDSEASRAAFARLRGYSSTALVNPRQSVVWEAYKAFLMRREDCGLPACTCRLKRTHDGRPVYPADATLPGGASGWTMVQLSTASYSSWLEPEDQERAGADTKTVRARAAALRTKAQAREALSEVSPLSFPPAKLGDMRVFFEVLAYERLWPCREAS